MVIQCEVMPNQCVAVVVQCEVICFQCAAMSLFSLCSRFLHYFSLAVKLFVFGV